MASGHQTTLDKVREIAANQGIAASQVTLNSDLKDLAKGVKARRLFTALEKSFDIDWSDFDFGIHFISKGFWRVWPWNLKQDGMLLEAQTCRISDIVQAVDTGRYSGTDHVPRPAWQRVAVYTLSSLYFAIFVVLVLYAFYWFLDF
ncbi:MAG: hypothetical protein O3B08_16500 [Proteobacteria bacterium]|nr:hypothetical protein [Pseudomonadota bacterium]